MPKEPYESCPHIESIGALAVYVKPGCRRANMIKGILVSSKTRCRECKWRKPAKINEEYEKEFFRED